MSTVYKILDNTEERCPNCGYKRVPNKSWPFIQCPECGGIIDKSNEPNRVLDVGDEQ